MRVIEMIIREESDWYFGKRCMVCSRVSRVVLRPYRGVFRLVMYLYMFNSGVRLKPY